VCLNVVQAGLGESAFIGIGGDPVLGTTTRDALEMLDRDPRTRVAVIVGELGGAMEEDAAGYARTMRKPVLAFIAGRTAPPGRRMGHAGAIVEGSRGTGDSKVSALRDAGVCVVDTPSEIRAALHAALA
jgi:succinyl-CoA synthetase alpha subunit